MTKEDYKEKVEELRQEIELEDDLTKRSRVSRHGKTKKKKQKNPIMTALVFVFILIPLGILFYVWFLFEPEVPVKVATDAEDKGIVVEIQNQEPKSEDAAIVADDKKDKPAEKPVDKQVNDEAVKQAAAAAEAKKVEEAKKAEEAEIKKAKEAQKAAAAKLEEQRRLAAEQARVAEEKRRAEQARAAEQKRRAEQAQPATASGANSHTVQSTDNLYRIALKYYGNGSAEYVNKIKQANGLSSDSISVGQVLRIPQ